MARSTRKRRATRSRQERRAAFARAAGPRAAPLEDRMRAVLEMSSDIYWEQDAQYRFTLFEGRSTARMTIDPRHLVGKRRWDFEHARPLGDGGTWERHRATLAARESFADFRYRQVSAKGEPYYVSTSGQPVFDREGVFIGYRGIARDVTESVLLERRQAVERAVTRALAEAADVAAVSREVLRAFCQTLDWACGARWELDAVTRRLRCVDTWGDGAPDTAAFLETTRRAPALLPARRGLVRRAFALGAPVWLSDPGRRRSFVRASSAQAAGLRTAFAFPVKAGAELLGVLEFYSREPQACGAELLGTAAFLGSSVGHYLRRRRAEDELVRFRAAMDMSGDAVYLVDRATMRFVDFNETACRVTGYSRGALMKLRPYQVLRIERKALERIYDRVIAAGSEGIRSESTRYDRDGRPTAVEQHRRPLRAGEGWMIVTVSRDISERKRAEEVLRESEARFRALTELSSDWYWELDAEFRFVRFEGRVPAADRALFEPLIGTRPWESPLEFEMGTDAFRALHEAHRAFKDAVVVRTQGDERLYFAASGEPVFGADGAFRGYRGVTRDITQSRLAEERIQHLATHDPLTGLPNRLMFGRLLEQAIESAHRYQRSFALLFVDLDRFKSVNDSLGHAAGDRLLATMASRLRECLRSSDVVARFGGDEFVVLLQETNAREQAAQVAEKLIQRIMQPAVLAGREFRVTSSIGIALYPVDGGDEQALMRNADAAMYLAKEEGKNNFRFYSGADGDAMPPLAGLADDR